MAGAHTQLWRLAALLARRPQQIGGAGAPLCAALTATAPWTGKGVVGGTCTAQQHRSLFTEPSGVLGLAGAACAQEPACSSGHILFNDRRLLSSMASAVEEEDEEYQAPSSSGRAAAPARLSAAEFRALHEMKVDDVDAPAPFQSFSDTPFPRGVLELFKREGYTLPTAIQSQAWPIALQGRDLVAIASTGSGKTAGFLLPAFMHILAQQGQQGGARGGRDSRDSRDSKGWGRGAGAQPLALVLAPTRELAQQIDAECAKFGRNLGVKSVCLFGGASKGPQGAALRRGPHIVIATPGRLLDFIEGREIELSGVKTLVLDEADRMLDMGFEQQIQDIMGHLGRSSGGSSGKGDDRRSSESSSSSSSSASSSTGHQTLFFSATWPKEVKAIARQFCKNDPVHVFIGNVASKLVANKDITQKVQVLPSDRDKLPALMEYLQSQEPGARVMVFCATKRTCDWVTMALNHEANVRCAAVHGDKTQAMREQVLRSFKAGRTDVLVATDVAARGLDIKGVAAVVNYDFPGETEMYIHRIGRTGRAGASGESLTLLTRDDASSARDLVAMMRETQQEVPAELQRMADNHRGSRQSRFGGRGGGRRGGGGGGGGGYGRRSSGSYGGDRGGGGGWRDGHSSRDGGDVYGSSSRGGSSSSRDSAWGRGGGGGDRGAWGSSSSGGGDRGGRSWGDRGGARRASVGESDW